MENNFNNRDFEQFVKQNADQYRMFPSEKVWNGIENTLHARRRWYGVGLILLLLTTGVVTWVMLNNSEKNKEIANTLPKIEIQQTSAIAAKKQLANKRAVIAAVNPTTPTSFITPAGSLQKNLYIADRITMEDAVETDMSAVIEEIALVSPPAAKAEQNFQMPALIKNTPSPAKDVVTSKRINTPTFIAAKANNYAFVTDEVPTETTIEHKKDDAIAEKTSTIKNDLFPLTIESVVNSYTHIKRKKKLSFEIYFSPTISYRELKENKAFINSARSNNSNIGGASPAFTPYSADVNSSVTHKPDAGLQLGFSAGYPLGKKLTLIGGLQFNISKYDIKAYSHPAELTTIALNNSNGRTNTVYTVTNYRNDAGYKADWLHNLYFSASAPIGLEYKLAGRKRNYFGVSGTVQPSFILSNRAYVLSTDFKNYAEIPSLIRKWNINTGFELFAGYTTGKVKWRIGPQVRYQVMSSFIKKYPVQEHLFDFGLKLGVMLNK